MSNTGKAKGFCPLDPRWGRGPQTPIFGASQCN
jgi:hypothetical protein